MSAPRQMLVQNYETAAQLVSLSLAMDRSTLTSLSCAENLATGGYPYPGIPKITDPYKKRQWQLEHMAGAFRVFARKGYTEGASGHISVRDPVDTDTFWINPLVPFTLARTHVMDKGALKPCN